MAVGEPPGRARSYPSKKGENAVIEWMKSYLMGLAGPLGAAADPSANMASQAGSFIPNQQLTAGGRVNAGLTRDAINRRAMESYDPATMQAGGGLLAAGLAATTLRRPGAALRLSARQIAKQRSRDLARLRQAGAATSPPRFSPQEMTQAAQAVQRQTPQRTRPPARFPSGKNPRTDSPRPQVGFDDEALPIAGRQPKLTEAEAKIAARKGQTPRQFLGEQETIRRLRETDVPVNRTDTGRFNVFSDPRKTSPEFARQEQAVRDARANTQSAAELGDTVENLMARPDLGRGSNTSGPRVYTGRRSQSYSDAELKKIQEQEAAQQAARKEAADAERALLKEQGLKTDGNKSPLATKNEDEAAYEVVKPKPKRSDFKGKGSKKKFDEAVAKWDAARAEFVQNRIIERAARPAPTGDASAIPAFRPNVLDSEYNPYASLGRMLETVKPAAAKTSKAKKPKVEKSETKTDAPEEMPIPSRSKPSKADKPDFANKSIDDSRTKKQFGPKKPKAESKPKSDTEAPREAGEKPRRVFPMGSKPESSRGVSTPLKDRPKRQAPDGGFAMPGRAAPEPASSRGKRGYLTAEQEKAIKDRAKKIYASGDLAEKKKFAGMMGIGAGAAAFPVTLIVNKIIDENVRQVAEEGAAGAAEEAVTAEGNGNKPKSKEAKFVLRDKYGRKITREEFNRREAFRKKLESMSPEERKAARKKEMARREKWRNTIGKQLFKSAATTATRNTGKKQFAKLDDSARRALRAS